MTSSNLPLKHYSRYALKADANIQPFLLYKQTFSSLFLKTFLNLMKLTDSKLFTYTIPYIFNT